MGLDTSLSWIKMVPVHHHSVLIVNIVLVCHVKSCCLKLCRSERRVIQVPHSPVNSAYYFEYHGPTW